MQIKSESIYFKPAIQTLFLEIQSNKIFIDNAGNIQEFFIIFQQIKQHRTLQKLCSVYTIQEKQQLFKTYYKFIERLEQILEKFQLYAKNSQKKLIIIDKQTYSISDWKQGIQIIYQKGKSLLNIIQSNFKMIIKAFKLQMKISSVDWEKWKNACIKPKIMKTKRCGCF